MASNLEELESKQSNLRRAFETAKAQTSSVIQFSLQWKDLEDHIESTKNSLDTRSRELEDREKEIGVKSKQLEAQELEYLSQRHSKSRDLHRIQKFIEDKHDEFDAEKKRLSEVEEQMRVKEGQLKCVEELVDKHLRDYELREANIRAMESKEKKFDAEKKRLSEVEEEVREKEEEYESIQRRIEEGKMRLELQVTEYGLRAKNIRAMELKAKELDAEKKRFSEVEEMIREKEVEYDSIQRRIEEGERKLQSPEKLCEEIRVKEVQLKQIQELVEKQQREYELKDAKVKALDFKANDYELLEESMNDWTSTLEAKEVELRRRMEELERKEKEIDSKADEVKKLELKQGELRITDGRGMQFFVNENLSRNDVMLKKIEKLLQGSLDPAKLVLDAMHGFYPSDSSSQSNDKKFELTTVRRSCSFLLRELKRVSPKINPQVREEAIKLAAVWKAKMKTENWGEVLGLLLLLVAYDLSSIYEVKELKSLVGIVAPHYDISEFCQALGIGDKTSDQSTSVVSQVTNIQSTATTDVHAWNLQNQVVSNNYQKLDGLAGKVASANLIQELIAKNHLVEAVVFICTLKLTDMFPPVPLLKRAVEEARTGSMTVDNQIYVLKTVIACVKDYNLESEYPSKDIEMQLRKLESLQACWGAAHLDVKCAKQHAQHNKKGTKRTSDFQAGQKERKKRKQLCYNCSKAGHIARSCPLIG